MGPHKTQTWSCIRNSLGNIEITLIKAIYNEGELMTGYEERSQPYQAWKMYQAVGFCRDVVGKF